MRKVLQALSHEERLICIWKLGGYSTGEIARHLNCSESDVESLFARAKGTVRRLLHEHGSGR
jgi:DNA-directed RNA polymerase specialized sigma24 family protein